VSWWHGGPRIRGDEILPSTLTGFDRSGSDLRYACITSERDLALTYACTCNGWLYEVEPIGPVTQDPESMLEPGVSMVCGRARILRRFKPSRYEVDRRSAVVSEIARILR
jgi:hypothetical protein